MSKVLNKGLDKGFNKGLNKGLNKRLNRVNNKGLEEEKVEVLRICKNKINVLKSLELDLEFDCDSNGDEIIKPKRKTRRSNNDFDYDDPLIDDSYLFEEGNEKFIKYMEFEVKLENFFIYKGNLNDDPKKIIRKYKTLETVTAASNFEFEINLIKIFKKTPKFYNSIYFLLHEEIVNKFNGFTAIDYINKLILMDRFKSIKEDLRLQQSNSIDKTLSQSNNEYNSEETSKDDININMNMNTSKKDDMNINMNMNMNTSKKDDMNINMNMNMNTSKKDDINMNTSFDIIPISSYENIPNFSNENINISLFKIKETTLPNIYSSIKLILSDVKNYRKNCFKNFNFDNEEFINLLISFIKNYLRFYFKDLITKRSINNLSNHNINNNNNNNNTNGDDTKDYNNINNNNNDDDTKDYNINNNNNDDNTNDNNNKDYNNNDYNSNDDFLERPTFVLMNKLISILTKMFPKECTNRSRLKYFVSKLVEKEALTSGYDYKKLIEDGAFVKDLLKKSSVKKDESEKIKEDELEKIKEEELEKVLKENELKKSKLKESKFKKVLRENELKENELKENELRENELRENELKENELRENELRENELKIIPKMDDKIKKASKRRKQIDLSKKDELINEKSTEVEKNKK